MDHLKEKAFFGVLLNSGNYMFQEVITLVIRLVLARLLIPEDFGLAAMAWVVLGSLTVFSALGSGTGFIRDNKSDPFKAKNTMFYMGGFFKILVAGIAFFGAPFVAGFFGAKFSDPATITSLTWMVRILALGHLFGLSSMMPGAILGKELRFKERTIANLVGVVVYGIGAVVFAFLGFGAWAIILGHLISTFVKSIIIFCFEPFIPSLIFDKKIAKNYFRYGKNSFLTGLMNVIIGKGDDTIIGRLLGAATLGFYTLGQHFSRIVMNTVTGIVNGVIFPVLSKVQEDKKRYSRAFFKAFRLDTIFTIPALGGAIVLAREIVLIFLGSERWLPVVPVFYVLAIATFFNNLVVLAGPVLNSLDRPEVLRNNRLIQLGFFIVLIYPLTKIWGLVGTSSVMVVFSLVSVVHFAPVLAKQIDGFYKILFKILIKIIPSTLLMMAVVYFSKSYIRQFFEINIFILLALVLLGIVVYFIPMLVVDKQLKYDIKEGLNLLLTKFNISYRIK